MLRPLDGTGLQVHPLCLGGNVFGWTADRDASFAVLDAYAAAGGNFIDTADVYGSAGDHVVGQSETIVGEWMASRGNRDEIVLATKVGLLPARPGLGAANVRAAVEDSLARLQTDHIDLYYAHRDDRDTPLEETLGAFDELVRRGVVRHVGASNYSAARLAAALDVAERGGLSPFVALQPRYNLVERNEYEGELAAIVGHHGLACLPYFALARGFLTGKYRAGGPAVDSPRATGARALLETRGEAVLDALDAVAAAHETSVAAVALAWLAHQPTVTSVIASARSPEQLAELLPVDGLELSGEERAELTAASTGH